jgi:signal recognition particle subunit SRP54
MGETKLDNGMIGRPIAIVRLDEPMERRNPQILHASRKRRIAAGSGTSVQDVNKLLKQHKQMQVMMKRVKKMGGAKQFMARGLPPGLLPR